MSNMSSIPVPDQPFQGALAYDARHQGALPPITAKRPPKQAPNVLLILLDDVGFGASSAFGGPVSMPTAERLAAGGLKYTRFHTTALCSPTRAALLSGRNHHQVALGHITETATPSPGYRSTRPNSTTPLPEILRQNGYNTAQFGKCHEVPVWESGPTGPFDHWPAFSGFERFYGFIGGETNQWTPALVDGVSAVEPPTDAGYHLMPDLADKAIEYIRQQKSLTPDKPFFTYFAPGATHAPHHVPPEWIQRWKGKFDQGWDRVREDTFARQKELGVVPADADLTARSEGITAWDDVDEAMKPVLSRQMEVYAAFLEYADHHTGRVIDALEELGILNDTLVYYIIGDNGASAEGPLWARLWRRRLSQRRPGGTRPPSSGTSTSTRSAGRTPTTTTPTAGRTPYAHALPVDEAGRVALRRNPQRDDHPTGPRRLWGSGETRHQWHHVIDVAPTILEAGRNRRAAHRTTSTLRIPMQGSFAWRTRSTTLARRSGTAPSTSS